MSAALPFRLVRRDLAPPHLVPMPTAESRVRLPCARECQPLEIVAPGAEGFELGPQAGALSLFPPSPRAHALAAD